MSFLGQPKRKPVNLGNKQHQTRQDILKQAEENRLARQNNRIQADAAVVLQASIRSKLLLRKERIKALRNFEYTNYHDNNTLVSDFIYVCAVFYLSRNPGELIRRVKESIHNQFLHAQLLITLNSLWNANSSHLDLILTLYMDIPRYPAEIIEPLHNYATRHPGRYTEFLSEIFTQLVYSHPQEIFQCAISDDTLLHLGVDLSKMRISTAIIELKSIPTSRIFALLRFYIPNPVPAAALIVQLVVLLPKKLHITSAQELEPLLTRDFIKAVLELNLTPYYLSMFLLPLLSTPTKLKLLMHLSILKPDLVNDLWSEFSQTPIFTNLLEVLESGRTPIGAPHEDWAVVIPMLELYSYRLIISGDMQMFGILDEKQTVYLSFCLKSICALICTGKYTPLEGRFNLTFFKVIKQLYIRSERRDFLPQGFWLIPHLLPDYKLSDLKELLAQLDHDDDDDAYDDDDYDEDEPEIVIHAPPFVEVLKRAPFFRDFFTRAKIFSHFISEDKLIHRPIYNTIFSDGVKTYHVNRENIVLDTATAFKELVPDSGIKTMLKFTVLSNGEPEPGIDGGGLTKEVLTTVCENVFVKRTSPEYSDLFIEAPDHTVYPNPRYRASALHRTMEGTIAEKYFFLGLVVGKCLHESIIVDVHFSPFFLQKWAGSSAAKSSFDDLYLLDPEMYSGLQKLSQYTGDVEDLALDFTLDDGTGRIVDLKPNGSSIPVTNDNKLEYIHLVSNFKLNGSIRSQTMWFLRGITYFVSPNWLRMFSTREVQTLISGENDDFDPNDLRNHTELSGFAMDHYVEYFWDVVNEMSAEERQALLGFVTSVPRRPLLGFAKLTPRFALRSAGRTDERLPTASTCLNLLKLPEYSSKEILREKLLYAINSNSGFDLS